MDGKAIDQDPMQMPSWSLGMAIAWIACRDIGAASELWRGGLESAWFADEDLAPNRAFLEAETTLRNALESGSIAATGLHNGQRAELSKLQWQDAKITFGWEEKQAYRANGEPGLEHLVKDAAGATFSGLRVNRADVLALWPAKRTAGVTAQPKRGPVPIERQRVMKLMVAYNNAHGDLATMKEEAMVEQFGAKRTTCREARKEVLRG